MIEFILLFVRQVCKLAAFFGGLLRLLIHCLDKVVGVDYGTLAGFHLAGGKLDHTIGEMVNLLCPVESELAEDELEYLEVVILLITDHIYV